jgi:polysaccharide export outer membrane protein
MRKPFILFLICVLWGLLLTSCITTRQTNYMQKSGFTIPSYTDTVPYQEYKLKEGDRLFILVYSMDEKTNALFNGSSNLSRE